MFARYWIELLRDSASDTDKNESISAMEAFQRRDRKTADFYTSQKRLATEHPVFEIRASTKPRKPQQPRARAVLRASPPCASAAQQAYADPAKRDLLAQKEDLEQKIDILKYQKAAMDEDDYTMQLKAALLALAKVQEELDKDLGDPRLGAVDDGLAQRKLSCAATVDQCQTMSHSHGHRAEAQSCYQSLTQSHRSLSPRRRLLGPGVISGRQ